MKKKIVGLFVCMLLIITLFPLMTSVKGNEVETLEKNDLCNSRYRRNDWEFVSNQESNKWVIIGASRFGNGDVVDQQQTENSGMGLGLIDIQWLAQGFTPTLETLSRVELPLFKTGDVAEFEIKCSIRDSLYGGDIVTKIINGSQIQIYSQWINFDFSDISVIPGQMYYIVCIVNEDSWENVIFWCCGKNNPYERGDAWISEDQGADWLILDFPPEYPALDFCFKTYGLDNSPEKPTIDGPTSGKAGTSYTYTFNATDPDGDNVSYYIKWGDGGTTDWTAFQASGTPYTENHTWSAQGTYNITAKAKDTYGAESEWGTFEVTMPRNKVASGNHQLILKMLQQFPNAFPLLQHLLGL